MGSYDAVLFDFDGVLADTEGLHFVCWREILARHGISLNEEEYDRLGRGVADREMIRAFANLATPPADFDRIWAEYPTKIDNFRRRALAADLVSPDTRELIADLAREGYRLAVVSSSARTEVAPLLERAGILAPLGALICREDVRLHKPDPEPYRVAAERLAATRPLVVEDSDAGEASGWAAGFEVLRIRSCAWMPAAVRRRLLQDLTQ